MKYLEAPKEHRFYQRAGIRDPEEFAKLSEIFAKLMLQSTLNNAKMDKSVDYGIRANFYKFRLEHFSGKKVKINWSRL